MVDEQDSKYLKIFLKDTLIKEVMTVPAICVHVDDDFSLVAELFVAKDIRHLPIIDGSGKLVGFISQRDLYRTLAPRKFFDGKVYYDKNTIIDENGYYEKDTLNQYILNYIMHKDPPCLTPENTIGDAIHSMVQQKVGCVTIVDKDKKPVGVITRFDVLKLADSVYTTHFK